MIDVAPNPMHMLYCSHLKRKSPQKTLKGRVVAAQGRIKTTT